MAWDGLRWCVSAAASLLLCAAVATTGLPEPARAWRVDEPGRGRPVFLGTSVVYLTMGHGVVRVDGADGRVRWRASTGEPGPATLGSSLVVAGDRVIAGDYDLVAFDLATGAEAWRFGPTDGYGPGLYLGGVAGGLVFAGSPSGRLYAVHTADGTAAWSTPPVGSGRVTVFEPVTDGSVVVAGFTAFDAPKGGGLLVVDAATGRERWRRAFPMDPAGGGTSFAGGPLLHGGLIIAASADGRIHAFDDVTGVERWRLPPVRRADGSMQPRDWRALAVARGTLVAGSASGQVTAWDLATRRQRWTYAHPSGGSIAMRLVVDGRTVYVPHLGGLLVAVDLQTGQPRWQAGGGDDGFSWVPAMGRGVLYAAGRVGLVALVAPASGSPDRPQ